jgi:hypothetical protein
VKTFRKDKETAAVEEQRQENVALFRQWLTKHPEIKDCDANLKAFEEYIEDFDTDPLTEADFEFALSNIPERRLVTQRVPSAAEQVADENARRKALPITDLKALARLEHPTPSAPALPSDWIPKGRRKPVDISTREALLTLVKTDYRVFRELSDRFGNELINQRLGIKPTAKPGVSVRLPI